VFVRFAGRVRRVRSHRRERSLNKSELIDSIAQSTGESKKAVSKVLDGFIRQIQDQVKSGDRVSLPGFGTFSRRERSARTARNPRTGEEIKVEAASVPAFKPGAGFKEHVSGSR
jgi:DNA-binding protein HU-beta